MRCNEFVACATVFAAALVPGPAWSSSPAGTGFTYQGQLKKTGVPVTGTADFEFTLWDAATDGAVVGAMDPHLGVDVVNGLFTVQLDFSSSVFAGHARWLEVQVAYPSGELFTPLVGRQAITPAPYALALPGLRTEPSTDAAFPEGPIVIGGFSGNSTTHGVVAATIAGGGIPDFPNRALGDFSTVSGGAGNTASDPTSTVGGGGLNTASGDASTVGGGDSNTAAGSQTTVGGGADNMASGDGGTVGGGESNLASSGWSTVPGGHSNTAAGDYSFAAGRRAKANHDGAFVWSDATATDPNFFTSTGDNQFLISAAGGVGINMNSPGASLHIGGTPNVDGIMFPDGTLQTTASVGGGGSLWTLDQPGRIYYDGEVTIGTDNTTASLKVFTEEGPAITALVAGEVGDGIVVSTVGVGTRALTATASGEESYGLDVSAPSAESIAIYAIARGANGTGINVLSTGSNGVTIKANARTDTQVAIEANATGTATLNEYPLPNTAGKFYASGADGVGILGRTDGSRSYGVHGKSEGSTGRGVYGEATMGSGTGVYGFNSSSTGSAIAVRGHTSSSSGYSGYFTGGKNYFAGRVGLGKVNPDAKLHIGGTPGSDGIMFPDGTLQTTAAVGGGGDSLWSESGNNIFYTAGRVGVGTSAPSEDLHVAGDSRFDGSIGIGTAPSTFSPLQVATGTLVGMKASTSFSLGGAGVWGESSYDTGEGKGVYGTAASPDGAGVVGESPGIGVEGIGGVYGVRGEADGSVEFSFGVSGRASTEGGRGVTAYNSVTEGSAIGVYGATNSPEGFGGFFMGNGYFRDALTIGGAWEPTNKLTVRDDPFHTFDLLSSIGVRDHTALIENEHTPGIFQTTGVLALRANSPVGGSVNYITFYQRDGQTLSYERVGSIEGDGSGGIVFESSGGDYAEWLPVADREEKFEPGDVVSVVGGRITKNTEGADHVMVISTAPIVVGNQPLCEGDEHNGYEKVAFIGQAPVKVLGPVAEGDFIIPSGLQDGTGVGVSPEAITPQQFAQVIGQAWESSDEPGLNSVRAVIGQLPPDPNVARMANRIRELEHETETLRGGAAALQARLESLEAIVAKLAGGGNGGK